MRFWRFAIPIACPVKKRIIIIIIITKASNPKFENHGYLITLQNRNLLTRMLLVASNS